MSNNFRNLHAYVCQRLLSLFETLAKKYHRLENLIQMKEQAMKIEKKCLEMKPKISNASNNSSGDMNGSATDNLKTSQTDGSYGKAEHVEAPITNGTHPSQNGAGEDFVLNVNSIPDTNTPEVVTKKDSNSGDTTINLEDEDIATLVSIHSGDSLINRSATDIINFYGISGAGQKCSRGSAANGIRNNKFLPFKSNTAQSKSGVCPSV